jgi:hypothetical protein
VDSVQFRANASVLGVRLDVKGSATREDGFLEIRADANLRLLGLPSLHANITGSVSASRSTLEGTFDGPGPLLSSYIIGSGVLDTTGVLSELNVGIFGLTFTPSIKLPDPTSSNSRPTSLLDKPINPFTPGGLTIGAAFYHIDRYGLGYVSIGVMPHLDNKLFSDFRVGFTSQSYINIPYF